MKAPTDNRVWNPGLRAHTCPKIRQSEGPADQRENHVNVLLVRLYVRIVSITFTATDRPGPGTGAARLADVAWRAAAGLAPEEERSQAPVALQFAWLRVSQRVCKYLPQSAHATMNSLPVHMPHVYCF